MCVSVESQPSSMVITTAESGSSSLASNSTASPSGSTGLPERCSRAMRCSNCSGSMKVQLPNCGPGVTQIP
jgi:hypothetical protein